MPRERLTDEELERRKAEGRRRRDARKAVGLTQKQVAMYISSARDGLPMSAQQLGELERGARAIPAKPVPEFPGAGRSIDEFELPTVEQAWDAVLKPAEAEGWKRMLSDPDALEADRASWDPDVLRWYERQRGQLHDEKRR